MSWSTPQGRVQYFSLGLWPKVRKSRPNFGMPRAGWGSWGVGSKLLPASPPARLSGGALWAPQRGSRRSPDRPQVSNIFSTQDDLSWHYRLVLLIVDYHAAIRVGAKTPCPLAYAHAIPIHISLTLCSYTPLLIVVVACYEEQIDEDILTKSLATTVIPTETI